MNQRFDIEPYLSRKKLTNILENTSSVWPGPPLSQFPVTLISNNGSPTIIPDGYYLHKSSVTLHEATRDSIKSTESFDVVNNSLYFQCILPNLKHMPAGNSIYICGYNWYAQLLPKNKIIFWNDDGEDESEEFMYKPGDLYYQYYDGYNINFGFVNQKDNTFQVHSYPLCLDTDVDPEKLWIGFDHEVDGSNFEVTIENIQSRYEGPNMTFYGLGFRGFDITGITNNITLPNSHTINLISDGNSVITGFTNGHQIGLESQVFQYGKEIILFNENSGYASITFNNMDPSSDDGNQIYLGNSQTTLILYPPGNVRLVYVPTLLSYLGVWKLLSYVQGEIPPE